LDDVIEFPKVKVLSEDEALDYLRREGPIEGISKFAKLVGWERTRAQRMLARWQRDGAVVLKPGGPGGKTIISVPRAAIDDLPAARAPAQLPVRLGVQPSAQDAHPTPPVAHPRSHLLGSILTVISPTSVSAAIAFFVAAGLGACGLTINVWFAISYARSGMAGVIAASVGAFVDLLAFWLPSGDASFGAVARVRLRS
jgi:hypothetical protein